MMQGLVGVRISYRMEQYKGTCDVWLTRMAVPN